MVGERSGGEKNVDGEGGEGWDGEERERGRDEGLGGEREKLSLTPTITRG